MQTATGRTAAIYTNETAGPHPEEDSKDIQQRHCKEFCDAHALTITARYYDPAGIRDDFDRIMKHATQSNPAFRFIVVYQRRNFSWSLEETILSRDRLEAKLSDPGIHHGKITLTTATRRTSKKADSLTKDRQMHLSRRINAALKQSPSKIAIGIHLMRSIITTEDESLSGDSRLRIHPEGQQTVEAYQTPDTLTIRIQRMRSARMIALIGATLLLIGGIIYYLSTSNELNDPQPLRSTPDSLPHPEMIASAQQTASTHKESTAIHATILLPNDGNPGTAAQATVQIAQTRGWFFYTHRNKQAIALPAADVPILAILQSSLSTGGDALRSNPIASHDSPYVNAQVRWLVENKPVSPLRYVALAIMVVAAILLAAGFIRFQRA